MNLNNETANLTKLSTGEMLNQVELTSINTIAIASCIPSLTVGAKAGGIIQGSTLLDCGALREDMRD